MRFLGLAEAVAVSVFTAFASSSATGAPAVQWSLNSHWYQRVDFPATWDKAKAIAESNGGYLATATNAAENLFISDNLDLPSVTQVSALLTGSGSVRYVETVRMPAPSSEEYIYWSTGNGPLYRARADGSAVQTVLTGASTVGLGLPGSFGGIAIDVQNGYLYTGDPQHLIRCRLDGSERVNLVDLTPWSGSQIGITDVELDLVHGKVYWVDLSSTPYSSVWRANLDGSSPEIVVDHRYQPPWSVFGLALDPQSGKMFYSEQAYGEIWVSNLDGTGESRLWQGAPGAGDLEVDAANGQLYWNRVSGYTIHRAKADGLGGIETVLFRDILPLEGFTLDLNGPAIVFGEVGGGILRASMAGNLSQHWLGGLQPSGSTEPAGGWSWVNGDLWSFSNWALGEPVAAGDALLLGSSISAFGQEWKAAVRSGVADGFVIEYDQTPPAELKVGSWPGYTRGEANDVEISGHYAFVSINWAGIAVFDLSAPNGPARVGGVDTGGSSSAVARVGAVLFVADGANGLTCIDISNPLQPTVLRSVDTPVNAADVAVSGSRAVVADSQGGVILYDITDPANPVQLGTYDTPGTALGVAISGNKAYVADGDFGLHILDISGSGAPSLLGTYDSPGFARSVTVSGQCAYLADDSAGLQVVSISDPALPSRVGGLAPGGNAWHCAISGNIVMLAAQYSGVYWIDVSNPANPVLVNSQSTYSPAVRIVFDGSTAYVANSGGGVILFDISQVSRPARIGWLDCIGSAAEIAVNGNFAYLADRWAGLQIVDISTPGAPVAAARLSHLWYCYCVAASGHIACLGIPNALQVIDVTDPHKPVQIGNIGFSGAVRGIALAGTRAYLATATAGLQIVNLANPASPALLGSATTRGYARGISVYGNRACIAEEGAGIEVFDISNPASPISLGYYQTPGFVQGVTLIDNQVYVSADYAGLRILDLSSLPTITEAGSFAPAWLNSVLKAVVTGNFAYIVNGWAIQKVDISQPATPVHLDGINTGDWAVDLAVSGNRGFVANSEGELAELFLGGLTPTAPSLTEGPATQFVLAGSKVVLNAAAVGTPPLTFNWSKDGSPFRTTTGALILDNVTLADAGSYTVSVANAQGSTETVSATLNVRSPNPQDVTANAGDTTAFTFQIVSPSALTYQWFKDGTPLAATGFTLSIANVQRSDAGCYTVTVTGAGVNYTASANLTVLDGSMVFGGLKREVYGSLFFDELGQSGWLLENLLANERFPSQPDEVSTLQAFETRADAGDFYGERLSGLLSPPVTGQYVFYLSADDESRLYLSPDQEPAHKVQIAREPTWNYVRAWTPNRGNVSAPISLDAGNQYYIEVLHKEGSGGDHVEVAWQRLGDPVPVNGSEPISGAFLTYPAASAATPSIFQQPKPQTVFLGGTLVLYVLTEGAPPLNYQWQFNGVDIPGATGRVLRVHDVGASQAGAYRVRIVHGLDSVVSTEAQVTVLSYGVRHRIWWGIPYLDAPLSGLVTDPRFPDVPSFQRGVGAFEVPERGIAENFAQSLSGYLWPPVSGNYTFYLSSDDYGVLYLSVDDDPAKKRAIAFEPQWSNSRDWTGTAGRPNRENISAPIYLEAGRRYYIEAINIENGGGDGLAVAWQRPGDPVPANGSAPIPGAYLTPPDLTFPGPARFVLQPQNQNRLVGDNFQFVAAAIGQEPVTYQWQRDGMDIAGATSRVLFFEDTRPFNIGTYRVIARNALGADISQPATVTVASQLRALTGPTLSSVNGHYYYLLNQSAWTAAEARARELGGHLVTIRNAAEDRWVFDTFSSFADLSGDLWIGLRNPDPQHGWSFADHAAGYVWINGETATYRNWSSGEPNNWYLLGENSGQIMASRNGQWNDVRSDWSDSRSNPCYGVVEAIPGPPQIALQPVGQTVVQGASTSLRIEVLGTPPFAFQWQKGGQDIPGATSAELTLLNADVAAGGVYTVVVTSPVGTVTSRQAVLQVLQNAPPFISPINSPAAIPENSSISVQFTVNDADTGPDSLLVSLASSNPSLVPLERLSLSGTGENRQLLVTPLSYQSGTATITVMVTDPQGSSALAQFQVTVIPQNNPPMIDLIGDISVTLAEPPATTLVNFNVADADTPISSVTVNASSSNPALVPNSNLQIAGTGQSRALRITPSARLDGTTTITLTANDGQGGIATRSFVFQVLNTVCPGNDNWVSPCTFTLSGNQVLTASVTQPLNAPSQTRWYRFPVSPGERVMVTLTGVPDDYNLFLFQDIGQAYQELTQPDQNDLKKLGVEFAPTAFSPTAFSPTAFSPTAFSPTAFSPTAFSPTAFSPTAFSPTAFSPTAFSPTAFSPTAFSPTAFSPTAFSPTAFSPTAFSPTAFSPTAFSPAAFSAAQTKSLIAVSAFPGTAPEGIYANTWNLSGYMYVAVQGLNGAFSETPFTLNVMRLTGVCGNVNPVIITSGLLAPGAEDQPPANTNYTLILTDTQRMAQFGKPAIDELNLVLAQFAQRPEVAGKVLDVSTDAAVAAANAQADANIDCVFAKNIVAGAIRDIVIRYRAVHPVKYVVLLGNDDVIPFFRYPDVSGLAKESNYYPPVRNGTSSQTSLRTGHVLGQDAYGASSGLSLQGSVMPLPELPVGRLVESPDEIMRVLENYMAHPGGALPTPTSSLVTGYDFLVDCAKAIQAEFRLGIGEGPDMIHDALIAADPSLVTDINPQGVMAPEDPRAWTAANLRDVLTAQRHDLIFLGGHYSAGYSLAADWLTAMSASELAASTADLRDSIVIGMGCHVAYNVVDPHAIARVTPQPDWAQAFAFKKVPVFIGGTGYQYGDTDFIQYNERLYVELARALRTGTGPVTLGDAYVRAKQKYLAATPALNGIDQKTLVEAAFFGLPMANIDLPFNRIAPPISQSIVTPDQVHGYDANPGLTLGLQYADVTITPSLSAELPVTMRVYPDIGATSDIIATYIDGESGKFPVPFEPILPLVQRDVTVANTVLRGVGFRAGHYAEAAGIRPLTGAPATEIRGVHVAFQSDVFHPTMPWSVNYFDALTGVNGERTRLDLLPAQYRSGAPGSDTGTRRRYDNMQFRLFYSANTQIYSAGGVQSIPALSAPPTISSIAASYANGAIEFRANVVGNPAAGIQEVWVTYTANSGALYGTWTSIDLEQDPQDSTLWKASLTLDEPTARDLRFMVQAVNGVGLVTLDTKSGAFYKLPPPTPPVRPTVTVSCVVNNEPVTQSSYASSVSLTATVLNGQTPVVGETVLFGLGNQRAEAVTGPDGVATATLQVLGVPGQVQVQATVLESDTTAPSSAGTTLTVQKQPATVNVDLLPTAGVSDVIALATDSQGRPLGEEPLLFVIRDTSGNVLEAVPVITDAIGRAILGPVPLEPPTPGTQVGFQVEAMVAGSVEVPGAGIVTLESDRYTSGTDTVPVTSIPEPAQVQYTGETVISAGADLHLQAKVSSPVPGAPLDLAYVGFTVYNSSHSPVETIAVPAGIDGVASAVVPNLPTGNYSVETLVTGVAFAAPPVVTDASAVLPPPTGQELPRSITDLAVRTRPGTATLTWTHVGAYEYLVYRKLLAGQERDWKVIGQTRSTFSMYMDESLADGTSYQYRVISSDADGNQLGQSDTVAAIAHGRPNQRPPKPQGPQGP